MSGKQNTHGDVIAALVISKKGVGAFDTEPPTSQNTFTQTYSTAGYTVAAVTVGSALGAFTDPPSAAEMAALRTFVNALRADVLAMKANDNAIIDELQRFGFTL